MRRGLAGRGTTGDADAAIEHLVDRAGGDGRQVLTALEVACAPGRSRARSNSDHVEAALGTSALRYGRDDHYDVISAFIKEHAWQRSAGGRRTTWRRMLEAGEDARFIARRMIIFASEDIGDGRPAGAAGGGCRRRSARARRPARGTAQPQPGGHPHGNGAEEQPVGAGDLERQGDVQNGAVGEVPPHLRDAHYKGAQSLGHGVGYDYPHDNPQGWIDQQYLPDDQRDKQYYEPSEHGAEADVARRMDERK